MTSDLTRALEESIQETFENMAFLETVPAENEQNLEVSAPMTARLEITSPADGVVYLTLSEALLRNIGEILHAAPAEELPAEALQDLLFELVNTITGVMLNKFLPEDQTYGLGLPTSADKKGASSSQEKQCFFLVDDTPVTISVAGRILSRDAQ